MILPDSNAEPINHKADALSNDPAREHILVKNADEQCEQNSEQKSS